MKVLLLFLTGNSYGHAAVGNQGINVAWPLCIFISNLNRIRAEVTKGRRTRGYAKEKLTEQSEQENESPERQMFSRRKRKI